MKVWAQQFNIYLALAAMLAAVTALLCGCETDKPHGPVSALRIHIEASRDTAASDTSQTVSVVRADPVLVTITKQPILTEANIVAAKVIDAPGGFAIEIHFDETGAWILEQYTAANPGLHLVIFGQWGEKLVNGRWLAAPLITHRISNGVLAFTADMSRAEADQLVLGLNDVANFNKKQSQ
jgi:preprotein translocase subunit SecD